MKFRKKPVVIEAEQFTNDMADGKAPLTIKGVETGQYPDYPTDNRVRFFIKTLEGDMLVSPKDWVITGVKGEIYPCKPDIFEATYEKVEG